MKEGEEKGSEMGRNGEVPSGIERLNDGVVPSKIDGEEEVNG